MITTTTMTTTGGSQQHRPQGPSSLPLPLPLLSSRKGAACVFLVISVLISSLEVFQQKYYAFLLFSKDAGQHQALQKQNLIPLPLLDDDDDDDDDSSSSSSETMHDSSITAVAHHYVVPQRWNDTSSGYSDPVPSPKYDKYWLVLSKARKVAITFVPKVMCTTLRTIFTTTEQNSGMCDFERCAEWRRNMNRTLPIRTRTGGGLRFMKEQNYTSVVMFRDPFERAYSAYTNSVENSMISLKRCVKKKPVANKPPQTSCNIICASAKNCSFAKWVDVIAKNPTEFFKNEHFLPQIRIAQFDSIHYDYRLRMSSAADRDFLIHNLMGVEKDPGKLNSSPSPSANQTTAAEADHDDDDDDDDGKNKPPPPPPSSSSPPSVKEMFDAIPKATIQQLAKIYQGDLKLWQSLLDHGTPRKPGEEVTMYDYYLEWKNKTMTSE